MKSTFFPPPRLISGRAPPSMHYKDAGMSLEDVNVTNIFTVMHAKINTLFDYLHGRRTGVDVVDYARKIKKDSDAIINHMSRRHDVDQDLSIASTTLMSLKNMDAVPSETKHTTRQARLLLKARKPKKKKHKSLNTGRHPDRKKQQKKQRRFAKRILSNDDIERMLEAVQELGGANVVSKSKQWKQIARQIRTEDELKTQTSASNDIKKIYFSLAEIAQE